LETFHHIKIFEKHQEFQIGFCRHAPNDEVIYQKSKIQATRIFGQRVQGAMLRGQGGVLRSIPAGWQAISWQDEQQGGKTVNFP